MKFTTNVGSADRLIRLILGAALVILSLLGVIGWWGWLGLILVGTAFVKYCPIYGVTGLSTTKSE